MISGIETVKAPKNLSQTQHNRNIYALDNYGFINVFCVDDFTRNLYALGLSRDYIRLILNVIHANLVYGLSQKIGVMPGLFAKGDGALKEYLYHHISDTVEYRSKEQAVDDLIEAWNSVAKHPEAEKQHILAGSTKDALVKISDFTRFVYYKPFIESIFDMVLNACSKKSMKTFLPFYMDFSALFYGALSCKPLRFNQFSNAILLQKRMKESIRYHKLNSEEIEILRGLAAEKDIVFDSQYSANPDIIELKQRFHPMGEHFAFVSRYSDYIQTECRTHIAGWAGIELSFLEEKHSQVLITSALLNLLEGNIPVSNDFELRKDLEALIQKIVSPSSHDAELVHKVFKHHHDVFSAMVAPQKEILVYQALLDAVVSFAQTKKISLQYPLPLPKLLNCLKIPREEILDGLLQGDDILLEPAVLFSIFQTSGSADIKDTVLSIIQNHLAQKKLEHVARFRPFCMGGVLDRALNVHWPSPMSASMVQEEEEDNIEGLPFASSRFAINDSPIHLVAAAVEEEEEASLAISLIRRPVVSPYFFSVPLLFSHGLNLMAAQPRKEDIEALELLLRAIKNTWEPVVMADEEAVDQLVNQLDQISLAERSQRKETVKKSGFFGFFGS